MQEREADGDQPRHNRSVGQEWGIVAAAAAGLPLTASCDPPRRLSGRVVRGLQRMQLLHQSWRRGGPGLALQRCSDLGVQGLGAGALADQLQQRHRVHG